MENEEFHRVLVHGRLSLKSHFYQPLSLIHAKEAKHAAVNQRNVTVSFSCACSFAVFSDQIFLSVQKC